MNFNKQFLIDLHLFPRWCIVDSIRIVVRNNSVRCIRIDLQKYGQDWLGPMVTSLNLPDPLEAESPLTESLLIYQSLISDPSFYSTISHPSSASTPSNWAVQNCAARTCRPAKSYQMGHCPDWDTLAHCHRSPHPNRFGHWKLQVINKFNKHLIWGAFFLPFLSNILQFL